MKVLIIYLILALCVIISHQQTLQERLNTLTFVEPHFSAYAIATIPSARQIAITADQSLLLAGSLQNTVYAVLLSKDDQGRLIQKPGTNVITVASALSNAHGVAVDDATGDIFVGYADGIVMIKNGVDDIKNSRQTATPITLRELPKALDDKQMHNRRHLGLKNGRIYVSIGAPCDACIVQDPYATLASFKYNTVNPEEQDYRVEARGIRNTVGYAWHPKTSELWFTDNGVDVNDVSARDELNKVRASDLHFGFPYCFEKDFIDTEFNTNNTCSPYEPAAYVLEPHVAALGMTFYTGNDFPEKYRQNNVVFIAEHGSLNLTNPTGYRISMVDPTDLTAASYKPFVDGFFTNGAAWGRPVDVAAINGQLIVSDDKAGAIYGIVYTASDDSSSASAVAVQGSLLVTLLISVIMLIF
jgi:glucose/arabinose dehydrogenase